MQLPEESIREFQAIWKKEYGEDITYEKASESAHNLINFFQVLLDSAEEDRKREEKLKDKPKGFLLDGIGYTCAICGEHTRQNEAWYDKYGIKCLTCQKGVDKKQISASMAKHKNTWYSAYDLRSRFNLKPPTLRKWVKEGVLKARTITNDRDGVHVQIYLIKDNKDFLPPKKLTDSAMVSEKKDGTIWYHSEPWYRFVNPFEHLKGYRIMDYITFVEKK